MPNALEEIQKLEDDIDNTANQLFAASDINGIPSFIYDVEIDAELDAQLTSGEVDLNWLKQNAAWIQLDNESDNDYLLFRYYIDLPTFKWTADDAYYRYIQLNNREDNETARMHFNKLYESNHWLVRRAAFVRYLEWLNRKKSEMEQLKQIADFRNSQATLLQQAGLATIELVRKLTDKIESIEANDIRTQDIPSFIGALSTFLNLASDAEARVLSISTLLDMLEDEIDSKILKDHLFYLGNKQQELQITDG